LLIMVVTIVLSLLMVSNVQFRSFKDLKLNTGTVLFVLFIIGSSAVVWQQFEPPFVLVWLLSMYIAIGILEWIRSIPGKVKRARERAEMDTLPPAE
ncbi:MAG: CDP-diacylglycerol--serine O-phosphatidyltransferase, partial [Polyangiaceae bacterium]